MTDGTGVDSAIEALGHPVTFANCIRVTRRVVLSRTLDFMEKPEILLETPLPEFGLGMGDKKIHGDVRG